MSSMIHQIRQELAQKADEQTQQSGWRFFKEPVQLYGVKTALVTNIGKVYFKEIKEQRKEEIFELCEELWKSGYLEESFRILRCLKDGSMHMSVIGPPVTRFVTIT